MTRYEKTQYLRQLMIDGKLTMTNDFDRDYNAACKWITRLGAEEFWYIAHYLPGRRRLAELRGMAKKPNGTSTSK